MAKEFLDLLEFLPDKIICNSGKGQEVKIDRIYDNEFISLSYLVKKSLGEFEYFVNIRRFISKSKETFEVLGLLQAEMGKTQNGTLSFANHEYQIINKVLRWFKKELQLDIEKWKWSIKVNINEPIEENYKREVENKVVNSWLNKTKIKLEHSFPKKVTYIKNTKNTKLKFYDKGTLVIEYKNNLFSTIIKNLVRKITYEKILNYEIEFIRAYMSGIIAGEGCIFYQKESCHRSVYVSVTKKEEKEIYYLCLQKLGIDSNKWKGDKLVISKKENNIQLLKQRLITLSHEKYAKFCYMLQSYPNIKEETDYFVGNHKNQWNKHSKDKINKIILLYKSGISNQKEIAEKVDVSLIKVNRVLRANNLGKRVIKIEESKRKEIAEFTSKNQNSSLKKIADYFKVHESVVRRACKKYNVKKIQMSKYKIPQEKIQKIIEIYKQNPTIKISEVCKAVGVSDTVVRRVRKENDLNNLGYMHLIGNNNKKYKNCIVLDEPLQKEDMKASKT